MGNFVDGLKSTINDDRSVTENGAVGFRTTGHALLDLNFSVASLRDASEKDIYDRFTKAFFEDKLTAMKWLFYARDVRGGLGERRLFRVCMTQLAKEFPDYVRPVVKLIPEYGRWDDLWCLLDTPLRDDVIGIVGKQLTSDINGERFGDNISLLAKWMPRCKTSSRQARRYGQILRNGLKMTERDYQHTLSWLSRHLKVVEQQMSAQDWGGIDYQRVPSRANLQYNDSFLRHDEDRRRVFLEAVEKGEAKINASVLFPHDIVHRYSGLRNGVDSNLEMLWKNLPDMVQGCGNTIVVADGSGSMGVTLGKTGVSALEVANALAIYFAERSSGQFKDQYITFSERPQLVDLSHGKNLLEKLRIAKNHNEVANTNVEAVFDLILATAINKHMEQSELPANILIISDMEFDSCAIKNSDPYDTYGWGRIESTSTLFEEISKRYTDAGYRIPRLVFWNVDSRTSTIPVRENDLGVALVSGFPPNIVKMVMSGKLDPYDCLLESVNAKRYQPVDNVLRPIIFPIER